MAPEETQPGVSESPGEPMDISEPISEGPGEAVEAVAVIAVAEKLHQIAPEEAISKDSPQIIDTTITKDEEVAPANILLKETEAASVAVVHDDAPPQKADAPAASLSDEPKAKVVESEAPQPEATVLQEITRKELDEPAMPVMANEGTTEVDEQPTNAGAVALTLNLEDQNSGVGEEQAEVEDKTQDALSSEKKRNKKPSIDPGFVTPVVKKGDDEYHVIFSGVKDTGLCGKYWADMNQLPTKRQRKSLVTTQPDSPAPGSTKTTSTPPSGKRSGRASRSRNDGSSSHSEAPLTPTGSTQSRSSRTSSESSIPGTSYGPVASGASAASGAPVASVASGSKPVVAVKTTATKPSAAASAPATTVESGEVEKTPKRKSDNEGESSANKIPRVGPKSKSEVNGKHTDDSVSRGKRTAENGSSSVNGENPRRDMDKAVSDYFASHRNHTWVNIGKRNDGAKPESVQYARALRPPYHLLSFLKIQGHSNKGRSYTDKNTLVFIVLEGDVTIQLNDMHFEAEKGDSFYIPPKNNYNILNKSTTPAELSLIQFQYDGNSFGEQQNQANPQAQRSN